ncbi:hypothetical protein NDU88_000262 [Pleurodeles waltl]|uniref:Uncharacterized protein n=1 Tax=Pleurodeles waltl TaxID=8319 RepID=A0AAV7S725_PLEWA|nr:hypothetical protein NDU88_000262 [Pleurodeles waltl]
MRIRLLRDAFYEPHYSNVDATAPGFLSVGMALNVAPSAAAEFSYHVCSFDLDEALVIISSVEERSLLDFITPYVFDDVMLNS